MNKLLLLTSIAAISCTGFNQINLTVTEFNPKKNQCHLSDKLNRVKIDCDSSVYMGDVFKLVPTEDTINVFKVKAYSEFNTGMTNYHVRNGKSKIIFKDSSNRWTLDSKFKLIKK